MQAGSGMQGLVSLAQIIRDGMPQRMLDHRKAPLGLVHRRGASAADFFGVPGFGDQALQALADLLALGGGEVAVILQRQLRGNRIVFLDQGAARHFGRVGSKDQLDLQAAQLAGQGLVAVAFALQARQQLRQHPGFERRWLRFITPVNQLVLLGNIGQVEKLVEGPRDGQQFVFLQLIEAGAQFIARGFLRGRATPVGLGALADLLDLVEKIIAVLLSNGVAQQLTQEVNILTQACIDITHQPISSQKSGTRRFSRVPPASVYDKTLNLVTCS